jgi:hypothetical protein
MMLNSSESASLLIPTLLAEQDVPGDMELTLEMDLLQAQACSLKTSAIQ